MTQQTPVFDRALIRRYDHQGPRYTSYPTAVQFADAFGVPEYRACALQTNEDPIPAPLSLYFHIPFCATVCYYCACNKVITANRAHSVRYLQSLYREIEQQGDLFDRNRPVSQLHWGGGTPTFLNGDQMQALMAATRRHFTLLDDDSGEYSIEIDPRTVDTDRIRLLRDIGFNRLSLGVQDFDAEVQRAVNRVQSESQIRDVIDNARECGFRSVSIDLIYGLPFQNVASFDRTLDRVVAAAPDRLSVFNYAHLPHLFKTQRQIDEKTLPPAEVKLQILQRAIERLTDAGYVYIGMDHFAKPEDELAVAQREGKLSRNFQGYATHGHCDIVGMGVSAISRVGYSYSQNERELARYQQRVDEEGLAVFRGIELTADDLVRRAVIMQLICHFELDMTAIESRYGIEFGSYFEAELRRLAPMRADGLIDLEKRRLRVLPPGRLLIRNICMVFDHYLGTDLVRHANPRYSKVI
jgi:oxygen-independent coproporphyrinogen-3 oxidase